MKKFFNYLWQCMKNIDFFEETVIDEELGGTLKYIFGLVLVLALIFTIGSAIYIKAEFSLAQKEFYNEVDPDFFDPCGCRGFAVAAPIGF